MDGGKHAVVTSLIHPGLGQQGSQLVARSGKQGKILPSLAGRTATPGIDVPPARERCHTAICVHHCTARQP
jgi:hypothetical protein